MNEELTIDEQLDKKIKELNQPYYYRILKNLWKNIWWFALGFCIGMLVTFIEVVSK